MTTKRRSRLRLRKVDKEALARRLCEAAWACLHVQGQFLRLRGGRSHLKVELEGTQLLLTTPFSRWKGASRQYGVEVWEAGGGKVFSVWWEPLRISVFRYGTWMNQLVPGSYPEEDCSPGDRRLISGR